jgi:hypothetical protein
MKEKTMKKNCWEIKQCGREYGGKNVGTLGVCPAAVEVRVNGIHNGKNGGRCCWVVAGTFCGGEVQGSFADKFDNCTECEFYALVTQEERDIISILEINNKIKDT